VDEGFDLAEGVDLGGSGLRGRDLCRGGSSSSGRGEQEEGKEPAAKDARGRKGAPRREGEEGGGLVTEAHWMGVEVMGSSILRTWSPRTFSSFWTMPLGQRISMDLAVGSVPRPKWARLSLEER